MRIDPGNNDVEDLEGSENNPVISSENKPVENKTISLNELKLNPEQNVVLVLGSEGYGVSKDVLNSFVNYNIYIPPQLDKTKINKHPFDIIDSLNVGVSAGIIINHISTLLKANTLNSTTESKSSEENNNTEQNSIDAPREDIKV